MLKIIKSILSVIALCLMSLNLKAINLTETTDYPDTWPRFAVDLSIGTNHWHGNVNAPCEANIRQASCGGANIDLDDSINFKLPHNSKIINISATIDNFQGDMYAEGIKVTSGNGAFLYYSPSRFEELTRWFRNGSFTIPVSDGWSSNSLVNFEVRVSTDFLPYDSSINFVSGNISYDYSIQIDVIDTSVSAVPEPSMALLFIPALIAIAALKRKQNRYN